MNHRRNPHPNGVSRRIRVTSRLKPRAPLSGRLPIAPAAPVELLRAATLLGHQFAVTDLSALLRRPASELTVELRGALAAWIITNVKSHPALRHPSDHQILHDRESLAVRAALHQRAAQSPAAAHAEPLMAAQQPLTAGRPGGSWARRWPIDAAPALAARAPELAMDAIQEELDEAQTHDRDWELLTAALAQMLLELGRNAESATRARPAVVALDPASRAQVHWLQARSLASVGSVEEALQTVAQALRQTGIPEMWRARLLATQAMYQRAISGDLDAAYADAQQAMQAGNEAGDMFAVAYALVTRWLINTVRRDHPAALECLDRALDVLGPGVEHADLRAFILDGRILTMQNLDRWPEAEATLRQARETPLRDDPRGTGSCLTAAVLMYWLGRWDDALAEVSPAGESLATITYAGLRERGPARLWHGVAALIAARRNDRQSAAHHLDVGLALPIVTAADRDNSDFLVAAQALVTEQDGDPSRALSILSTLLRRQPGEMTLVHQWLPDIVRLALAVGDHATALAALRTCQAEAAAERLPARAAAATNRSAGLLDRDVEQMRQAVAHYRANGPEVDLAGALEDLAVVLADRGKADEARAALNEAIDRYGSLGATWDIGRAERRLRTLGIRRGVRGPRPHRPISGWEALTPTELRIAIQIAQGQSTPNIAQRMFLSPRTVQTHISHILNKLDARSRVDIAREAFRRGTGQAQLEAN